MSRAIPSSLLIGVLIAPTLADAAIYGWHDVQGVAHYVSDPQDVPAEYRAQVVTVAKDVPLPPLIESSPEGSPAGRDEVASPVSERATDQMVEASYEWGYRAGLDAAASMREDRSVTSIVQNVQIIESLPPTYISPYPFFGPVLTSGRRFRPRRSGFPVLPMTNGRFIQGPAGPPPLGAPGPPPVSYSRR